MTFFADLMNGIFDLGLGPFGDRAAWAMVAVAAVSGVLLLLLFKLSTDQQRLVLARRRLMGHIYEIGLYKDELGVMLRIQRDLAAANLRYLSITLPALVVLTIPVILILAQLDARIDHRPLHAGEASLVTARLLPAHADLLNDLQLQVSDGIELETYPVRDARDLTATWRIRVRAADSARPQQVRVVLPDDRGWSKHVPTGDGLTGLATLRRHAGLGQVLFHPTERPLPADSPLADVSLELPEREVTYAGIGMNWLVAFCVFSLLIGLALKDVFKVKM
jgi:hypothetical protein